MFENIKEWPRHLETATKDLIKSTGTNIVDKELKLREEYAQIKPAISEDKQKAIDKNFSSLRPIVQRQGYINDLRGILNKYETPESNFDQPGVLVNLKRISIISKDLNTIIEGLENAFSNSDISNKIGETVSWYTEEKASRRKQIEDKERELEEITARINSLDGRKKGQREEKQRLKIEREGISSDLDWANEYSLEIDQDNFNDDLKEAFKKSKVDFDNLLPEQRDILNNLMNYISLHVSSSVEMYNEVLKKAINELKESLQLVDADEITASIVSTPLKEDLKKKTFNEVDKENQTNLEGKYEQIENLIDLQVTEKERAALISSLSAIGNAGIATVGIFNSLKEGTFEWSQALPAAGVALTQLTMNVKNFGPGLEAATKSMLKFAEANKNTVSLQTTKGIPAFMQATKALLSTKVAIGSTTVAMGTLIGVIGGGVLAIGLLVAAIIKWNNRQKDALDAAKKQTAALQENYNTLAAAANEFKQSISDYDEAIEALKNLKEGTDEYKDSLEKVNEQAKLLIETYGLWDKYNIKNGVITIDVEELEKIQSQKDQQALTAEGMLYSAKTIQNVKQQDLDFKELRGQIYHRGETGAKININANNLSQILDAIEKERSKSETDELFKKDGVFENFIQELVEEYKKNRRHCSQFIC